MDYKEKVEWLGRYQASVSCQHMLEEEIEVLRSDAERVTACMSGMPGRSGPNADRLPRAVERIEEAQKRLEQQLESCMETRAEIMCGIMTAGAGGAAPPLCDGAEFFGNRGGYGGSSAPGVPAAPDGSGGDGRAEAGVKKISVNFPKISQNFIVFHNQQW